MLRFLEGHIDSSDEQLVLLAPMSAEPPDMFARSVMDPALHQDLLHELQRLRGRVYLEDGAIAAHDLTRDGRHESREDYRAWHLLVRGRDGVNSCVWFMDHDGSTSFDDLRVRTCPLVGSVEWGPIVRQAIGRDLDAIRRNRLRFVELGGWAVSRDHRHTGEGLLLALSAYALGRAFGGALGLTTATVRHASSTILRRLGGHSVDLDGRQVPSYFDERYGCEMELLRFDSRTPNARYDRAVELLRARLLAVPVVSSTHAAEPAASTKRQWRSATAAAEAVA